MERAAGSDKLSSVRSTELLQANASINSQPSLICCHKGCERQPPLEPFKLWTEKTIQFNLEKRIENENTDELFWRLSSREYRLANRCSNVKSENEPGWDFIQIRREEWRRALSLAHHYQGQ